MLMLCAWSASAASASAVRGSALFTFPAQNREETRHVLVGGNVRMRGNTANRRRGNAAILTPEEKEEETD